MMATVASVLPFSRTRLTIWLNIVYSLEINVERDSAPEQSGDLWNQGPRDSRILKRPVAASNIPDKHELIL